MATLQKIRSKGPLLVGVIALALFAFVAGDAFKVFQPHQPSDVGEVDGSALSIAEFQKKVEEVSEIQKMMTGSSTLSEESMNGVKDHVWDTFVNNKLIENEAKKVGLVVTDQELSAALDEGTNPVLRMVPMFFDQQTGRFDKDVLFKFLVEYDEATRTPGLDPQVFAYYNRLHSMWKFVENNLVQNLLATKYLALLSPAASTNKIEAEDAFKSRTSQADVQAAIFPYLAVNEGVEVTKEDLKKEYNSNKAKFEQPYETRIVKYIDVKVTPSVADVDSLESEVSSYVEMLKDTDADYTSIVNSISNSEVAYNDTYLSLDSYPQDIVAHVKNSKVRDSEVFGPVTNQLDGTINAFKVVERKMLPESYEYRMLMVGEQAPEVIAAKTDSIINELKKGDKFEAIAEAEGQSKESRTISEKEIRDYSDFQVYQLLTSMKNRDVKMIPTQYGNLIVQLVSTTGSVEKYKLAIVKRRITISDETSIAAYNAFSQFVADNATMEEMKAKAEDAGYQVSDVELGSDQHNVANIASSKDALRWIFDAKTGTVSNIFECGEENDHLLVVALEEVVLPGVRPLHLVENDIRLKVLNDKKAELLSSQIVAANATSIDDLKDSKYATVDLVKYVTFNQAASISAVNANENVVSGYASVAKENKMSAPIKGDFGVYVLNVQSRNTTEETFNLETETKTIERTYGYLVNNSILQDLVDKAKIVDTRYKFF